MWERIKCSKLIGSVWKKCQNTVDIVYTFCLWITLALCFWWINMGIFLPFLINSGFPCRHSLILLNILRIFYYYFISTALIYSLQVFHMIASMSPPPQPHNLCSTGDWEFLLYTQIIIQMLLVLICINFHPKLIHLTD